MFFVCGDDDGSVWKWVEVGEVVFGGVSGDAHIVRVVRGLTEDLGAKTYEAFVGGGHDCG